MAASQMISTLAVSGSAVIGLKGRSSLILALRILRCAKLMPLYSQVSATMQTTKAWSEEATYVCSSSW